MQQPNAGLGRTNGKTQYRTQSNPFIHIADALTPLTVIQVYAPTNCASPDVKDAFYRQLQQQLEDVPNANLLLLMGDFNAKRSCGVVLLADLVSQRPLLTMAPGCCTVYGQQSCCDRHHLSAQAGAPADMVQPQCN